MSDDLCLGLFNADAVAHDGTLTVRIGAPVGLEHRLATVSKEMPTSMVAAQELTFQPAVSLIGQVIEVGLIHEAAHSCFQLSPATIRVESVGHTDEADAAMLQLLEHAHRRVRLARESTEVIHYDSVEGTCGVTRAFSEYQHIGCAWPWKGRVAAIVEAPDGWLVDVENSGAPGSFQFSMYPLDHTRESAMRSCPFLYGNIVLKTESEPTMEAIATRHERDVTEKVPDARFERLEPLRAIKPQDGFGGCPASVAFERTAGRNRVREVGEAEPGEDRASRPRYAPRRGSRSGRGAGNLRPRVPVPHVLSERLRVLHLAVSDRGQSLSRCASEDATAAHRIDGSRRRERRTRRSRAGTRASRRDTRVGEAR